MGDVDPRVFGGFLEHMGRCVYEGVFEPASAHADEDGFRGDVLAALARLQLPVVRYPGGNFASGYHWADGVGPADNRPTVRELAWQSIETNQFGTDEFISLCRKADWQPMLAANLGTGTPEEARNWVEYCNSPVGSRWSDQRAANGNSDPFDVLYWCLGNEMDGPWQLGHVPAADYAALVSSVRSRIDGTKRYPRLARRAGFEGRTLLKFKILPDGRVTEIRVLETSQFEMLDEAAMRAVERAAPFQEEGRQIRGKFIEVILPVVFQLR
ncbi:MAG: TonB family protein [SAR324 cluster bacterium]|nr:TonB family protein [SAR324 cluster bacterium]